MAKVLIVAGNARSLIANRGDMIRHWQSRGHSVHALIPSYDFLEEVKGLGIEYTQIALERQNTNPLKERKTTAELVGIMRAQKPDVVFSYTVKPVVFGSIAAKRAGVPVIGSMVTGLGYMFTGESPKQRILRAVATRLYRKAFGYNRHVFFQNPDDLADMQRFGMLPEGIPHSIVGGSGINLDRFPVVDLPAGPLKFLMIARVLTDKGVAEYVEAATKLKAKYPNVLFEHVGPHDPALPHAVADDIYQEWQKGGIVSFVGGMKDVRPKLAEASVLVLPSYREGTPRSVLEAMATGRPIVTTDAPGCRETTVEGETGFLVPIRDSASLATAMERFILDPSLVPIMGRKARERAEGKYDVRLVNAHLTEKLGL